MARSSLSKSPAKLNLSRREALLFKKMILAANHMDYGLRGYKSGLLSKNQAIELAHGWVQLMVELLKMLL